MSKIKTVFEIPEDAYLALSASGYSKEKIARDAKELLAGRLFKIGTLSLGKAAELAEMSLGRFIDFLNTLEIPVISYDDEELSDEFKTVKELTEKDER